MRIIIVCATCTLFARINVVKDSDIPMLELVQRVSPVLAVVYALISIMNRKFDEDAPYTEQDRVVYDELGQQSVVDTETIKQGIHDTVKQEHENNS